MIVKRLKESRERLDLLLKDVATVLNVNVSTISNWENGYDTISLRKLVEYANHYDYSLDYLFGLTKNNKNYYPLELNLNLIATNLKKFRKKHNLTQKEIASKFNTSQGAYSHYECGHYLILTSFLYCLTKIDPNLSIDEFLGRKPKYS